MLIFLIFHSTLSNAVPSQKYITATEEPLKIYEGGYLLGSKLSAVLEEV